MFFLVIFYNISRYTENKIIAGIMNIMNRHYGLYCFTL
jgi:hypothetical protein